MLMVAEMLETLPDGEVLDVRIGLHWTAVVAAVNGTTRCGLASTLSPGHNNHHAQGPEVPQAGQLEMISGRKLAELALSPSPTQASVGVAALNALLPRIPNLWSEENVEDVIARCGESKRVAMVGHFPFVPRLRSRVGELLVLEQNPVPGDLPAEMAIQVLPKAEVVVITGMALINHTLEDLLNLCSPQAYVMVLGPSTPLSPVLFKFGVRLISGAVVTAIEPVLHILSQGGNFQQMHRVGVRTVNMFQNN